MYVWPKGDRDEEAWLTRVYMQSFVTTWCCFSLFCGWVRLSVAASGSDIFYSSVYSTIMVWPRLHLVHSFNSERKTNRTRARDKHFSYEKNLAPTVRWVCRYRDRDGCTDPPCCSTILNYTYGKTGVLSESTLVKLEIRSTLDACYDGVECFAQWRHFHAGVCVLRVNLMFPSICIYHSNCARADIS